MRILLLEDDVDLGELLALGLRNAAYATDHARTCAEARELLSSTEYDVACIDLGLPDGDGLDLIRALGTESDYLVAGHQRLQDRGSTEASRRA